MMNKIKVQYIVGIFLFLMCSVGLFDKVFGQQMSIRKEEDSLRKIGIVMVYDSSEVKRFEATQGFIRQLRSALAIPYSFDYAFDSLDMISRLYAPDSSFRIFTWEVARNNADYNRQFGAIQKKTKDGSLQLFPLFDFSDFTEKATDSVRDAKHWIGAIYYKIILNEYQGKKYYTLLGLDDNDFLTTKKWIEVLTFDQKGAPVFGGDFFQYKYDTIKPMPPVSRFCLEFKKDTKAHLNYDQERKMIVFDHLFSESGRPWEHQSLLPDGDYEGFRWKNGKWIYFDNVLGKAILAKPPINETGEDIF